ncbi:hypothetical protein JCM33374_g6277 [Metschnikowia sp. JCM 33374]|nr:hypothetical protein JCM33374_g6277 [Metschnikowia sp. JCM 33374]
MKATPRFYAIAVFVHTTLSLAPESIPGAQETSIESPGQKYYYVWEDPESKDLFFDRVYYVGQSSTRTSALDSFTNIPQNSEISQNTENSENTQITQNTQNITNEARQVQDQIQLFFESMKAYIFPTGFDVSGFENQIVQFDKKFSHLDHTLRYMTEWTIKTQDMYRFVKVAFDAMKRAVKDLNVYDGKGQPDEVLLHSMIELNVRLLAFYNAEGNLDTTIEEYQPKLNVFWRNKCRWVQYFRSLQDLPNHMKWNFEYEKNTAERLIEELLAQVPQ